MATITDFKEWLGDAEPEGYLEVYALYKAVEGCSAYGIYDVAPAKGSSERWIVSTAHSAYALLLASNAAREAFLHHVKMTYADPDLDMDAWYSFKHAMEKND